MSRLLAKIQYDMQSSVIGEPDCCGKKCQQWQWLRITKRYDGGKKLKA